MKGKKSARALAIICALLIGGLCVPLIMTVHATSSDYYWDNVCFTNSGTYPHPDKSFNSISPPNGCFLGIGNEIDHVQIDASDSATIIYDESHGGGGLAGAVIQGAIVGFIGGPVGSVAGAIGAIAAYIISQIASGQLQSLRDEDGCMWIWISGSLITAYASINVITILLTYVTNAYVRIGPDTLVNTMGLSDPGPLTNIVSGPGDVQYGWPVTCTSTVSGGTRSYKYYWGASNQDSLSALVVAANSQPTTTNARSQTYSFTPTTIGSWWVCCVVVDSANQQVAGTQFVLITGGGGGGGRNPIPN